MRTKIILNPHWTATIPREREMIAAEVLQKLIIVEVWRKGGKNGRLLCRPVCSVAASVCTAASVTDGPGSLVNQQ